MVLGCARLVDGGVVQIDAGRQAAEPASACLWLTFGPPRSDGLFACGPGLGREPRVLLVLRHRSPSPFLVVGVAPADVKRVAVAYSTAQGTRRRTRARMVSAGARLAERVGAPEAFGAFAAELDPVADVCQGLAPTAFDSTGSRSRGPLAIPSRRPLGRPDGWLSGFAPSYGVGYGPHTPRVCDRPVDRRPGWRAPSVVVRAAIDLVLGRLVNLVRSMMPAAG